MLFIPHNCSKTQIRLELEKAAYNTTCLCQADEDSTAQCFLAALRQAEQDNARCYLSKNFADTIELGELTDVFASPNVYKMLLGAEFEKAPKNSRIKSVLVIDALRKPSALIHLRMIREPDNFSNWKIYSVERE